MKACSGSSAQTDYSHLPNRLERIVKAGRRLAQLVFWLAALQLVFGGLQQPGPGFVAPALAVYLVIRLRRAKNATS
jgi:hypothetical protein